MKKHEIIGDCFIVPMPLNANGEGPETNNKLIVKETWQIWDESFATIADFSSLKSTEDALELIKISINIINSKYPDHSKIWSDFQWDMYFAS